MQNRFCDVITDAVFHNYAAIYINLALFNLKEEQIVSFSNIFDVLFHYLQFILLPNSYFKKLKFLVDKMEKDLKIP